MPSAYVLAKDYLQQAQAILSNEVWKDEQVDTLITVAIARLHDLESVHLAPAGRPRHAVIERFGRKRPL